MNGIFGMSIGAEFCFFRQCHPQFEKLKEVPKLPNYRRHDSICTNAKMYNFQSEVHLVLDSPSVGCVPLTTNHPATSIHKLFGQVFPFHILRHSQPGPCIETFLRTKGLVYPLPQWSCFKTSRHSDHNCCFQDIASWYPCFSARNHSWKNKHMSHEYININVYWI